MKIDTTENILIGDVEWIRSPNHSGFLVNMKPDTIVIHYTGGSTAEGAINTLCDEKVHASAHLVIDRDGKTTQLVPFDTIAWHAGRSRHEETGRENINRYSIGIELVNAGPLTRQDDDNYIAWFGRRYPKEEVIQAIHRNETLSRYWHLFTELQLIRTLEICTLLAATYPIKYLLGHDEISPNRKTDPGPAFPLERFRDKVLSVGRDQDAHIMNRFLSSRRAHVNTYYLNVRIDSKFESPTVPGSPIEYGHQVEVLETSGKWCRIKSSKIEKGWVNGKYLEMDV